MPFLGGKQGFSIKNRERKGTKKNKKHITNTQNNKYGGFRAK